MTIRIVVSVPEDQHGSVEVRSQPLDGVPFARTTVTEIAPGSRAEFHVWGASAIQIAESRR